MTRVPLRTTHERLQFCDAYFQAVQAELVYSSHEYREYRLPRDVDKELTDRPFYWMWAEKTNQEIVPTVLRLSFTEEAQHRENERLKREAEAERAKRILTEVERMFFRPPTAELVNLGCFRLEKIYESVDRRGRFACVQPKKDCGTYDTVPWLMTNGLIALRCDSIQQTWFSIGICLDNGDIVPSFYEKLKQIQMIPASPTDLLRNANISINAGLAKLREKIQQEAVHGPHAWAVEAEQRLHAELRQLDTYYNSLQPELNPNERELMAIEHNRKSQELKERSQPYISISVHQCALIGLPKNMQ